MQIIWLSINYSLHFFLVIKGDNTLLKSSIVTYIQLLICIIVLLCDTKSNNMSKTVFPEKK
jgi:hypothetical protein